jgi:excisionase family DNA binding protein
VHTQKSAPKSVGGQPDREAQQDAAADYRVAGGSHAERRSQRSPGDRDAETVKRMAYSPRQVAGITSLSLRKVMGDIAAGSLRSYRKGRRRVILRSDLLRYLKAQ